MNINSLDAKYTAIFQKAFENATLGIVISSQKKGYALVNNAFAQLVGYSKEEVFAKTFEELTHPDDLPANKILVDKLLNKEIPFYDFEKRFIHKNGSPVWVKVHTSLIEVDNDEQVFFVIVRNIEEEIKARVEQQKLSALVEHSVDLMAILELNGSNSYLNKAGREMLGFDNMEEVIETPISALHSPEHFEQVSREVLPSVMNEGKWSGAMFVRHLKTGAIFPVYNNTVRIDDKLTRKPIAVGAVMRDLRPEIAARNALIEREKQLRTMIDQAPVAIALLKTRDMIIEAANDAILELWGKSNVAGMKLMDALPELKGQPFIHILQNVFDTGESYYGNELKAVIKRKEHLEDCYFNFVYAPIFESNQISGVVVVATEVTTQVKARHELAESEQRFKSLIMEAPMATAVYTGKDMVIQLANDAMVKLWGKDDTVIGKTLLEALPEIKEQNFMNLLLDVYETGKPFHSADYPAQLVVDGKLQTFYFNFTYKPLKDTAGKIYGILNMAVDVTEQKRIAEELEQTVQQRTIKLREANTHLENVNKNLEQFAYVTSHDLQEPLRKIRIFSDVLQNKYKAHLNTDVANYLDKITTSSKRMSELIQDVLDFSRVESQSKKFTQVDLNVVLQRLLIDYELRIKEKKAIIEIQPLPVIEAVPVQMNQLFYNILGNALKFTKPEVPPQIKIACRTLTSDEIMRYPNLYTGESYFEITVADTGIGFNQEFAENIFVIFQRLNSREQYEGTGIGLAICKKIVLNHNGHIFATSQENIGSTFHIILPKSREEIK